MATNLALDDELIDKALKLGGHRTKKETVTAALQHYIRSRQREGLKELIGKVEYYEDYDYKANRRRPRGIK